MSSERSVGVHMVGQLVGEPAVWFQRSRARPRLTAKSSHTISETARCRGGKRRADAAVCGTGAPDVHFPALRPLSLMRSGITGQDGVGMGGRWQTQEAACRGQAATVWQVTQVNKLDHKEDEISPSFSESEELKMKGAKSEFHPWMFHLEPFRTE